MDDTSAALRHTLPQSDPGLLPCGFPPINKVWGSRRLCPIAITGELPCEGKLHRRYSHRVGFQILLCFWNVLRNEGFYSGRSANSATNLLIKSNPTAGGCPHTKLGTRYGWPLAHKELLRPLTCFVLHPAGCPYQAPSSPQNLVRETV